MSAEHEDYIPDHDPRGDEEPDLCAAPDEGPSIHGPGSLCGNGMPCPEHPEPDGYDYELSRGD